MYLDDNEIRTLRDVLKICASRYGSDVDSMNPDVARFVIDVLGTKHLNEQETIELVHNLDDPEGTAARIYQVGDDPDNLLLVIGGEVINGMYAVDTSSDYKTITASWNKDMKAHLVGTATFTFDYNLPLNDFKAQRDGKSRPKRYDLEPLRKPDPNDIPY